MHKMYEEEEELDFLDAENLEDLWQNHIDRSPAEIEHRTPRHTTPGLTLISEGMVDLEGAMTKAPAFRYDIVVDAVTDYVIIFAVCDDNEVAVPVYMALDTARRVRRIPEDQVGPDPILVFDWEDEVIDLVFVCLSSTYQIDHKVVEIVEDDRDLIDFQLFLEILWELLNDPDAEVQVYTLSGDEAYEESR